MGVWGSGERTYRRFGDGTRATFRVQVETTDLYLLADRDLAEEAGAAAQTFRKQVSDHIAVNPAFATALRPLPMPDGSLPALVASMYEAALRAGVGPMAAVAGAIAGAVGKDLRRLSREIVVENGGDVYLDVAAELALGILAGPSPFGDRLALRIHPSDCPLAVCTSSGTVGPSLSYGKADAATVLAPDPALADAVATALGNRVQGPEDLEAAVRWATAVEGVTGAVAVAGGRLAAMGRVEFADV